MEVTIFLFKFPGSIQGYFSLLTLAMPFTDFTGSSAIQLIILSIFQKVIEIYIKTPSNFEPIQMID